MCRVAQMWIHMCGVHVCGGIQMCWYTWMGGNIHVWAHTFMYQHMHVEVKEVLGEAPQGSFIFYLHRISLE